MKTNEILKKLLIEPKEITFKEGSYKHNKSANIYTNADETDFSYLLELAGFEKNSTVVEFENVKDTYILSVGKEKVENKKYDFINDEQYYMEIAEETIVIAAKTVGGMLLGLKAFIRMSKELDVMPQMEINDWPDIPFRAVHTCIFRPDDGTEKEESSPEYIKKMMKTAAICGYNHIFVEFWGMFPYSLDYAHWPNAYSKEEIKYLVSYAIDKLHITPIPQQNLTSHAGWSRIISRKHTVLDQRPDLEDMYIPGGWCFATENPKTQEFIKTLIDELLEMFRNPPYLHCGCDKAFGFGSTEEDRRMSADVLFAKHISFLNSYLSQKNVRMVMWADMLYCSMDALYWKCREEIIDYLPKNILMNIWTHDNPGKKWQDAAYFEEKGFETVYAPFLNKEGIGSMVEICHNRKSHGIVQTTWHKPQTAVPCVILSGALQWCGKRPDEKLIENYSSKWYK